MAQEFKWYNIWLFFLFLLLGSATYLCPQADGTDYKSPFRDFKFPGVTYGNAIVPPGTHRFIVDGVGRHTWAELYVNGDYLPPSQESHAGNLYRDPTFSSPVKHNDEVIVIVYKADNLSIWEKHLWLIRTPNRPPTTPGKPIIDRITRSSARVQWSLSTDPDNDEIEYTVEYKRTSQNQWITRTTKESPYTIDALFIDNNYDVRVIARDNRGGESPYSGTTRFRTLKNLPPTQPGGPISVSKITPTSAEVCWGKSTDPEGDSVSYKYRIKRSSNLIWPEFTETNQNCTSIKGLSTNTLYDFEVLAIDNLGAESPVRSGTFRTTTPPGSIQAILKTAKSVNTPAANTRFAYHPGNVQNSGANPHIFQNITPGGYWVEGYNKGPLGLDEYWGSVYADVKSGQQVTASIVQYTPHLANEASDVWIEYNGTRIGPNDPVPPGATIVPKMRITNGDKESTWTVYGDFSWRYGTTGNARETKRSPSVQITKLNSGILTFPAVTLDQTTQAGLYAQFKISGKNPNLTGDSLTQSGGWRKVAVATHFDAARIDSFVHPKSTILPGSEISVEVKFTNTGSRERRFWVGLSFSGPTVEEWPGFGWLDVPPLQVPPSNLPAMAKGGQGTATFKVSIPSWIPDGQYKIYTKLWDNYDETKTEYTDSTGKLHRVAGLMTGDPFDGREEPTFTVKPSTDPDPYGIGSKDPGEIFFKIPLRHRNASLYDLPQNLKNGLRSSLDKPLTSSDSNIIAIFPGWRAGQEPYDKGPFGDLKTNLTQALSSGQNKWTECSPLVYSPI